MATFTNIDCLQIGFVTFTSIDCLQVGFITNMDFLRLAVVTVMPKQKLKLSEELLYFNYFSVMRIQNVTKMPSNSIY